jgi:hypothetical protein
VWWSSFPNYDGSNIFRLRHVILFEKTALLSFKCHTIHLPCKMI